ncbi:isoaspartyl peptidase/L-asparaginase family protein [Granulicella cerasi]|uniref:Isoaspartyl peptidase/L-asparaginase family protein n=1 Tax=Granulicella cerasi TaxID=741063 RepID=A0ABW1Z3H5_9BACT|nr:isoaspartyl peptidase/L-asparaginase [Granulicella cerasi]
MKSFLLAAAILSFSAALPAQIVPGSAIQAPAGKWAIVMHGGAGVIERKSMTPEREKQYRAGLEAAMTAASKVLDANGTAIDAVQAGLQVLEDDPHFNAGKGAVFTATGRNELDASIMDGATLKAGAVAEITRTRHPIAAAKAVMLQSPHVMLVGDGADQFAASVGLEQVPPSYFFTEERWQGLVRQLKREGRPVPPRPEGAPAEPNKPLAQMETPDAHKWGTTGMVVRDKKGNIAAGTTTGGTQGKRFGRIGDSPIIGAGTYASNDSCAVSATGTGEYFIRLTVARTICALVQYKGMKLADAADEVIHHQLNDLKGDGGIIALTPDGQMVWSFNTPGMFRARMVEGGSVTTAIYRDEP